jgi:bile acid-coenzyme A ligase
VVTLESVAEALARLRAGDPDRVVVTLGDVELTAAELDRRSDLLGHYFAQLGVTENDLVTIALPNHLSFIESAFAIWKLGATPQPVSSLLPGAELEAIVDLADPSLVLGVDPERLPDRTVLPFGFEVPDDVPDGRHPIRFARYNRAPTSGGSTGRPKLIVDTRPAGVHRDPLLPSGGAAVVPGPLYHTAPFSLATRSIMLGTHVTVFERFDAEATIAAVDATRAEFLYLVPTMMSRIAKLPDEIRSRYDLSSLETVLHAAAPCPPWLKRIWIDWVGDALVELYSSSEGAAKMMIRGHEWLEHPGSVGRPRPTDEILILDDDLNEVPVGTIGEIYMRSSEERDFEYRGADRPKDKDGFVTVGDMGRVDEDGYLYLADRRKDLILRGGANIFPAEVEAALEAHPAVRSVAVIGRPDDDLGQRVHAIVDAPGGVDEAELRAHMAGQLVRYKCPESYEFVDTPVRDDAGKVRRSTLRDF